MSFYTSLTGLNAAQSQLGITSNNVANVGTVGFKKSRAEFGDIFATSPLENASSAIGQGVLLKEVKQQFSQGNIEFSSNSLDLAISGQGFFALKPNLTSNQTVYTRAGSFSVNNDRYVVDSKGQYLQTFPVNEDGSVIATGLTSAKSLQLPSTAGLPQPSSKIELGLNLPADAEIIPQQSQYDQDNPYEFDRNDTGTFNKSTSITVYDSLGNPHIATVYYVKTSSATEEDPTNKWDTKIYIGDEEMKPSLIPAKNDKSETLYMNKFGQVSTDPASVDPTFNASAAHPLYYNDDQQQNVPSETATFSGGFMTRANVGHDFGSTDSNKVTIGTGTGNFSGTNFVSVSVDGSAFQSITIPQADYTGTELAAEMTRQLNSKFGDEQGYLLGAAQTVTLELQDKNGNDINKDAAGAANEAAHSTNQSIHMLLGSVTTINKMAKDLRKTNSYVLAFLSILGFLGLMSGGVMLYVLQGAVKDATAISVAMATKMVRFERGFETQLGRLSTLENQLIDVTDTSHALGMRVEQAVHFMDEAGAQAQQAVSSQATQSQAMLGDVNAKITSSFTQMQKVSEQQQAVLTLLKQRIESLEGQMKKVQNQDLVGKMKALIALEQQRYYELEQAKLAQQQAIFEAQQAAAQEVKPIADTFITFGVQAETNN